ncbi:MAG: heavy-metal-associated domain-containing protein [Cyclobacteriaceae bacterium]|nr:heavy-metal-associated domain-containing protein [Cyclobacteriaceae bacterium]UYN87659.1 MAG: heavy-metal-associated domain-containing protein [Cyclobacteriaceae bacterium]
MKKKKFKTNIKCSVCVATVTPFLNETAGEGQWKVDLTSPERTLTVETDASEEQIREALLKAGYNGEKI